MLLFFRKPFFSQDTCLISDFVAPLLCSALFFIHVAFRASLFYEKFLTLHLIGLSLMENQRLRQLSVHDIRLQRN